MRLLTVLRGLFHQPASSRTTTWLACCAIVLAGFIAVCIASLVAARSDTADRAETAASAIATTAANDVARAIEQYDAAMQTTISRLHSPVVMGLDEAVRNELLFDRALALPTIRFVDVLDEYGAISQSPQSADRLSNWASRDYFVAQRLNPSQGLFVSRPFGHGSYLSIALSRRISHEDGTFGGVVVAGLRLGSISELFQQLAPGPHGSIALVRNDGLLLMRLPFDEDAINRTLASSPPVDQGRARHAIRQVGELPLSVEVAVANEDVAGQWQDWTLPVLAAGVLLGAVCVALIAVLRHEVRAREAAERANRRKADYLAMTSHELRGPIEDIMANAECLRADGTADPTGARRLAAIVTAGKLLREKIERAMNYFHIEARLPQPRMGRVVMEELLEQCCNIVEPDAARRGLGLRYGFKPGAPEQFVTDGDLLRQILVNLLGNAIKFTERGDVTIEVGGTLERLTMEVVDTGCGISPERRYTLFDNSERRSLPGKGIGLVMSRRLVQCLGGDIGFRDNPVGGSIFWIGLPAGILTQLAAVDRARALQFAVP